MTKSQHRNACPPVLLLAANPSCSRLSMTGLNTIGENSLSSKKNVIVLLLGAGEAHKMSNKYGNVSAYYNGNAYFDRNSDKYSLKYCTCS